MIDLVRNMFKKKLVNDCVEKYKNEINENYDEDIIEKKIKMMEWEIGKKYVYGKKIMGIVVFENVIGIKMEKMEEKGKKMLILFE